MIKVGSKIQVLNKPDSCCGVIKQGYMDYVSEVVNESDRGIILVLNNNEIVWESDVREVT